jgi:hypothetical protein
MFKIGRGAKEAQWLDGDVLLQLPAFDFDMNFGRRHRRGDELWRRRR